MVMTIKKSCELHATGHVYCDILRLIVAGHKRCFVDEQPALVSPVKFPSLESRDKQVAEYAFQTS